MSSLIFLLILALVIFFIKQYNTLQKLTVEIKEARANIIVAYEKKVAIINQYSGLVDEYGDYEKSIQLKVSDNFLEMARATAKAIKNLAKEGTDKLRDTFDKKPAEFKPQDKPEQSEQPTSVEELEQQVLKQNELGKSVDTEETKQDDKK